MITHFEYKLVEMKFISDAEKEINELAKEGWSIQQVIPANNLVNPIFLMVKVNLDKSLYKGIFDNGK